MIYNRLLVFIFILASNLDAGEISAFGAGDISSATPYGLTSAEKHILKNKKKLDSFDTNVKGVKSNIEMIGERIDGLESILEGDSQKLHKTTNSLSKIKTNIELNSKNITQLDQSNKNAKIVIEKLIEDQLQMLNNHETFQKNQAILKKDIDNLTKLVNKINSVYVSENELKSNMSQFVTKKEFDKFVELIDKQNKASKKAKKLSKSKAQMMAEAKTLYKKQYFTKAIPIYEELVRLNYKPAESNYMLGEMWYVRKEYKKALSYFRTSATLYDKGKWMPDLLLHSAISFENINDLDNASSFYNTLIDMYPDTKQAKEAQKNILN